MGLENIFFKMTAGMGSSIPPQPWTELNGS